MTFREITVVLLLLGLAGCGGESVVRDGAPDRHAVDLESIPDAVPKTEPKSRYGNPQEYTVWGKTYQTLSHSQNFVERGKASWYGTKFHGRRTSSGERYNMYAMTAAHKSLPIPTYVRVTNLDNGKSVTVRVNDRGPFHENRIIDLSYAAAARLDMLGHGTANVEIRAIHPDQPQPAPAQATAASNALVAPEPGMEPVSQTVTSTASASVVPPEDAIKQFYVQVGAYSQVNNAIQMKQKLQSAGLSPVRVHTEQLTQGTLYKVQLGPLATLTDADRIRTSLQQLGMHQVSYVSY